MKKASSWMTIVVALTLLNVQSDLAIGTDWKPSANDIYYDSGRVGIGTIPNSLLHLKQTGGTSKMIIENNDTGGQSEIYLDSNANPWVLFTQHNFHSGNLIINPSENFTSPVLEITRTGRVGIGTIPNSLLHLKQTGGTSKMIIENNDAGGQSEIYLDSNANPWVLFTQHNFHSGNLIINPSENFTSPVLEITRSGRVGIGVTQPQSELSVNGTITAKEVKVIDSGWSDFVFADDYKIRTLESVASYIKSNKHLPDIPSAGEIAREGIALSDMLAKQMQKIEELTLYLIELKNENDLLKQRVAALEVKRP